MIEVLIALTILILGIVAVMRLFPLSLRQSRAAYERSVAREMASSEFDKLRAAGGEDLLVRQPLTTVLGVAASGTLFSNYQQNVQRLEGASETALQRVTFSVQMLDGRRETYVTYVARP